MLDRSGVSKPARLKAFQGNSFSESPVAAARELGEQIFQKDAALNIAFFSDTYNLPELAGNLRERLSGPLIGCTSSGQISFEGYQLGGISGISLLSGEMVAISYLIHPLTSIAEQIFRIAGDVKSRMEEIGWPAFGILLVDGMSFREEVLVATLYRTLESVPIFGGSAGDMLKFEQSFVLYEGRMYTDAAVFTIVFTPIPFQIFKHQDLHPSSKRLVITEAEPARRIVTEINGEPAASAYAELVGVPVDQLNAEIFSRYPLLLNYRDDHYVRSIAEVGPGGSLKFYCAINAGLVLSLGVGTLGVDRLKDTFSQVSKKIGKPSVIIGCDCILRRLELETISLDAELGRFMAQNKVFGFNTYGEQFNSLHVNQTFTGVAIAG